MKGSIQAVRRGMREQHDDDRGADDELRPEERQAHVERVGGQSLG